MTRHVTKKKDVSAAIAAAALLVFLIALALYSNTGPGGLRGGVGASGFSTPRAMEHLRKIAVRPHPIGSLEHAAVRGYLVESLEALGLETEVQEATVTRLLDFGPFKQAVAGRVRNVVARLPGQGGGKALLLAAHYDSVPTSPGAADDGAAVAAILETVRALGDGDPLENDVIVLVSDAEEVGLLGAQAFVDQHRWAADIGLVLNFEARGNEGPVLMFETGESNGWLARQLAAATSDPAGSSFASTIYRFMPNSTDFAVFKEKGWEGLNFAFIRGFPAYHKEMDTVENLDPRSLEHQGMYLLGLCRRLGNLDLGNIPAGNAVFFDVAGFFFVYSETWAVPLAVAALALLLILISWGRRQGALSTGGILRGFFVLLLSLLTMPLIGGAFLLLVMKLEPSVRWMPLGGYDSPLYALAAAVLAVAAVLALDGWLGRKRHARVVAVAGLLLWSLAGLAVAIFLPGASYLFFWPVLGGLAGAWYLMQPRQAGGARQALVLVLSSLPAFLFFVPLIDNLFLALAIIGLPVVAVLVGLLTILLLPVLRLLAAGRRWVGAVALAAAAVALTLYALVTPNFDAHQPKPSSVFYVMDPDTGEARWASRYRERDDWSENFLSADAEFAALPDLLPFSPGSYLSEPAPRAKLEGPRLEVEERTSAEVGKRLLALRVDSPRGAPIVQLKASSESPLRVLEVDGKGLGFELGGEQEPGKFSLFYFGVLEQGWELLLEAGLAPIEVHIFDQSYGLPELSGQQVPPRPAGMMAFPGMTSDSTGVHRRFEL